MSVPNLFFSPTPEQSKQHSAIDNKRDKYRLQIRKSSLNKKFGQIRKQLVNELQSETLKNLIKSFEIEGFNQDDFKNMTDILQSNCPQAAFSVKFAGEKLEEVLTKILMNNSKKINHEQKGKILSSLNYLTYFSNDITHNITNCEQFIEYLRIQIKSLHVNLLEDIVLFHHIINLLMNLSSILIKDFNQYLAESDVCNNINEQIAITNNFISKGQRNNYTEAVFILRNSILRLYKNIVTNMKGSPTVSAHFVQKIFKDQINIIEHSQQVFALLAAAMKQQGFFNELVKIGDQTVTVSICQAMDKLQQRCFTVQFLQDRSNTLTQEQSQIFSNMLDFLNQMYYEEQNNIFDWDIVIEQMFNGFMLAQFLFKAIQHSKREQMISALSMYVHLSRNYEITADQLIIVRPADDQNKLIKTFAGNQTFVKGCFTAPYCFQILTNLLKKNPMYIQKIMEQRITDVLQETLSSQEKETKMLLNAIELVHQLIISDSQIAKNSQMLRILQSKGIIQNIDKLSNHKSRQIYTRVQNFNDFISKLKKE